MQINLYNTLTRQKELFEPIESGVVTMYHCGPTVYDYAHIGNFRSYIFADILRRTMEYAGFSVQQVMNITDVDDKIIKRARDEDTPWQDIAQKYERVFWEDMRSLMIKEPHEKPRASDHIGQMVSLIQGLIDKGAAYRGEDGSVYFDVSQANDYGELAQLDRAHLKAGARIASDDYDKEEASDFVLWKAWKPGDGEAFWETSLGKGRPGWHIECSAMSTEYLGQPFDIHTGGSDLIFPHHTNEIAQSESYAGAPLAHFWLHNGFITVDGKKMAKSEGNFVTLKDVQEKGYNPLAFRLLVLQTHYRSPMNFTWEALTSAAHAWDTLYEHYLIATKAPAAEDIPEEYKRRFGEALADDVNTPQALAVLWDAARSGTLTDAEKHALFSDFDRVLGLFSGVPEEAIPAHVRELADKREAARGQKDFAEADRLREEIHSLGFEIRDTDTGSDIRHRQ